MAIGILTYNRDELLKETLESFFQHNSNGNSKIILVDNGSAEEYQISNRKYAGQYGLEYKYNSFSLASDMNENIEIGHHILIKELLNCDADLFCILEDDWKCKGKIPVDEIWQLLNEHAEIGQVRIRDYRYDDTFYGGSSLNFITKKKIVFDEIIRVNNITFKVADMHWVNCCNVMRKDTLKAMDIDIKSEYEKMQFFYGLHPRNAQFEPGIFYHIGPHRIRVDLREKGLFSNEDFS